jgi:hypothetical protein
MKQLPRLFVKKVNADFSSFYKHSGNIKQHLGQLKFGGSEPVIQAMTGKSVLAHKARQKSKWSSFCPLVPVD